MNEKHIRCPILCLAPALCRREALLLFAATAIPASLAVFKVRADPGVYAANRHWGVYCYVIGGALLRSRQAVDEPEGIV
jgi:hypothetical protein